MNAKRELVQRCFKVAFDDLRPAVDGFRTHLWEEEVQFLSGEFDADIIFLFSVVEVYGINPSCYEIKNTFVCRIRAFFADGPWRKKLLASLEIIFCCSIKHKSLEEMIDPKVTAEV